MMLLVTQLVVLLAALDVLYALRWRTSTLTRPFFVRNYLATTTTKDSIEEFDQNDKVRELSEKIRQYAWKESKCVIDRSHEFNHSCSHILRQLLPYDDECREPQYEQVVRYMQERQALRADAVAKTSKAMDKARNHMIAIAATPGMGKSSFIAHFADSKAYKRYLNETGSQRGPIVIAFTFNSAMHDNAIAQSLACRMVFGAIRSMSISPSVSENPMSWDKFYAKFGSELQNASDAIAILEDLYGSDRRKLVLVDEVSKVTDSSKRVLSDVGGILGKHGELDVIVTSLTKDYVNNLLTDSQRKLDYVILPTLRDSKLVESLTEDWLQKMKTQVPGLSARLHSDTFVHKFLSSIHLFFGDYGRALERFFQSKQLHDKMMQFVLNEGSNNSLMSLIQFLRDEVTSSITIQKVANSPDKVFESILLKRSVQNDEVKEGDRSLLEAGLMYAEPAHGNERKFRFTVMPQVFFQYIQLIQELPTNQLSPKLLQVKSLFQNYDYMSIAELFERVIALSIATERMKAPFQTRFGISLPMSLFGEEGTLPSIVDLTWMPPVEQKDGRRTPDVVRFRGELKKLFTSKKSCLIIPPKNMSGFDMLTFCSSCDLCVYGQVKIQESSNPRKNKLDSRMLALERTLKFHMESRRMKASMTVPDDYCVSSAEEKIMKSMVLIYYEYEEKQHYSYDEVKAWCEQHKSNSLMSIWLQHYVSKFYNSNVGVVDKTGLESWMPPTLTNIARMVRKVAGRE